MALAHRAPRKAGPFAHIDWFLFAAAFAISMLGLVTMHSYTSANSFFDKQIIWISIAVVIFFLAAIPNYNFLQRTRVLVVSGSIERIGRWQFDVLGVVDFAEKPIALRELARVVGGMAKSSGG